MCTALGDPAGAVVGTVEHLMAALAICEIDNLLVEVSGPELPIMDGSAQPFVFLIECAGTVEQEQPRRWIEVLKPVSIEAHGKFARLEPADRLIVDCAIHFEHPLIDSQALCVAFDPEVLQGRDRSRPHLQLCRTLGGAVVPRPGAGRLAQEHGRGQP